MTRAGVSIGQVLDELRVEFPDISPSKIRFLEAEGLIQPLRSSSGYRRFAVADIERLRFILTAQRDEYLPLRVIKERLDVVDGVAADGGVGAPSAVSMTRSELLAAARAAEELLAELEDYGLVRRARAYGTQALSVVRAAALAGRVRHPAAAPAGDQGGRRARGVPGGAGGGAAHPAEGQPRARAAWQRMTLPGISPGCTRRWWRTD